MRNRLVGPFVAALFATLLALLAGCGSSAQPQTSQSPAARPVLEGGPAKQDGPTGDLCKIVFDVKIADVIGELQSDPRSSFGTCMYLSADFALQIYSMPSSLDIDALQVDKYHNGIGPSPCPGYDGFTHLGELKALAVCHLGKTSVAVQIVAANLNMINTDDLNIAIAMVNQLRQAP